jgi:hypothetical protein
MDSDMKMVYALIVAFFILPMLALGAIEWRKQDCRLELAKVGRTVEEIKEICK